MFEEQGSARHSSRTALLLVLLMFASSAAPLLSSSLPANSGSDDDEQAASASIMLTTLTRALVLPSLGYWISQGEGEVLVIVITEDLTSLDIWQREHGLSAIQQEAGPGEKLIRNSPPDLGLQHRPVTLPAWMVEKLASVSGVRLLMPDPGPPEPMLAEAFEPATVTTGGLHGATDAWAGNITGKGIRVAVADSGIDFAHPDLNGTQARVNDTASSWDGWPIAYDPRSMEIWQRDGDAYPDHSGSWFSDTSTLDEDLDADGLLDDSNINLTGIPPSISGVYHIGEHPDPTLQSRAGGDVPVVLVDDLVAGVYTTVYVDTDLDGNLSDEQPMAKGSETAGRDTNGDGLWDRSAGMLYWIADGNTSLPYGPTWTARAGFADRIPGNGNLTLFMINQDNGAGGNHGTLCASAISAQGVVSDGKVLGMAPDAELVAIANIYAGGSSLDVYRFVAEGYDGNLSSGDEAHIASFSFGWRPPEGGADGASLYLDWLTRVHSPTTVYLAAAGNGGHGYGTVAAPGASPGIITVGAFSSRGGDNWGQSVMWTDRGPNALGRMDPDIVAVGWSATGDTTLNQKTDANSAYTTWAGTSLSTPVAAGLTALVLQAWVEETGDVPTAMKVRDLIMSTADDRGYDPFVQGAGWFDAERAVDAVQGVNGSLWVEPAYWMAGENHGANRDANLNLLLPGQSDVLNLSLSNSGATPLEIEFVGQAILPLSHQQMVWNASSSLNWDGHQSGRPDIVIPLDIRDDANITLDANTTLIRARAVVEGAGFDEDQNFATENEVYISVLRWKDNDGDGIWWDDIDGDGEVDDGEWEASGEYTTVTTTAHTSPQVEARFGMPLAHTDDDGILIGVWRNEVRTSAVDPVRIEIDVTTFGPLEDSWIQTPANMTIPAASNLTALFGLNVPLDAHAGLHQQAISIRSTQNNITREWPLPVIVNVGLSGPTTLSALPLDGNLSNQTLYRSTWMQGAQGWGWREESGDWKSVSVNWPANLSGNGSILVDVDWPDNNWTDVDAHWMSEQAHPYFTDDPLAYGPNQLTIETQSQNMYSSSGKWGWSTNTGSSSELLQAQATPGIKQLLLHSTMHGVDTNDAPLNITLSYVNSLGAALERTVDDWSLGDFDQTVLVGSTSPLDIVDVRAVGWIQPLSLVNQSVSQDLPGDWSSSSYSRQIRIEGAQSLEVDIDSNRFGDDLDLALYRDANSDGIIDFGSEQEATSATAASRESISIDNPADGDWFIVVHGYDVPTGNTSFWLEVEMLAGQDMAVGEFFGFNQSTILQTFPNGSSRLGGLMPASVHQLNLSAVRPPAEGVWKGIIELELNGSGAVVEIPYRYELVEWPVELEFTGISSGEYRNESSPLSLHMLDRGAGFTLDGFGFNATITPDNISNTTHWELNQWHDFTLEAVDTDGEWLDLTSTWLGIQGTTPSAPTYTETSGVVIIEVEDFTDSTIGTGNALNTYWSEETSTAGFSGRGYLEAKPNNGVNTQDTAVGPRLDYEIDFNTVGTYSVYVRALGPTGSDDSVHAGINGTPLTYGGVGMSPPSTWEWVDDVGGNLITFDITNPGMHTFNLWMREDGTLIDKVVLQQSGSAPTGLGPGGTMLSTGFNAGLVAEFFDNAGRSVNISAMPNLYGRSPDMSRIDTTVDYASTNGQWTGLGSAFDDEFSTRHTGYVRIDVAGNYTFYVDSDDGSRLWIDSQLVVDNPGQHSMRELSGTTYLNPGYHPLRLEFFEHFGWAGLHLSWESSNITKQIIPASNLFYGAGNPIRQSDLVGWWPLDETNGTNIEDLVSGQDMTLNGTNGTAWTTCRTAYCHVFDGVDDYAEYDIYWVDQWSGDFTVSMWVKAGSLGQPDFSSVFATSDVAGDHDTFQFMVDGQNPGTYQLYSDVRYDLGPVDDAAWVHLAASLENTTLRLYYNGLLATSATIDSTAINDFELYRLGRNRAGSSFFEGAIDDVRVYDAALSAREVLGIYNTDIIPDNGGMIREAWLNFSQDPIEGQHTFVATLVDDAGLSNSTSAWLIHDHTDPVISALNLPYDNLTNMTLIGLQLALSEPVDLDLDGAPIPSASNASLTLDLGREGQNQYLLTARDRAGNWGHLEIVIIRDTTLPAISLFPLPETPQNVTTVNVTGWVEHGATACMDLLVFSQPLIGQVLADCDLRSYKVEEDAQGWRFSRTYNVSNTSDGELIFKLHARDWAGNWNRVNTSMQLDTTPPQITWLSPTAGGVFEHHNITLEWTIPEWTTQYVYHGESFLDVNDGEGFSSLDHRLSSSGLHEFCILAIDLAQNTALNCSSGTLSADIYDTDIFAPWDEGLVNTPTVFAEVRGGPDQTYSWGRFDGTLWHTEQVPTPIGGEALVAIDLEEGDNQFRMYVSTLDGYVIYELRVVLDTQAPLINITSPSEAAHLSGAQMLVEGYCEKGLVVEIELLPHTASVDCDFNGRYSGVVSYSIGDGPVQLTVRSTDGAGNSNSSTLNLLLDTVSPHVVVGIIRADCDPEPIPAAFEEAADPLCRLSVEALFSGDDITAWSLVAYHDGYIEQVLAAEQLPLDGRIVFVLDEDARPGSWEIVASTNDAAGNSDESRITVELNSEQRSALEQAARIGSSYNLALLLGLIAFVAAILILRRRGRQVAESYVNSSTLVDPEIHFDGDDLGLEELDLPIPEGAAEGPSADSEVIAELLYSEDADQPPAEPTVDQGALSDLAEALSDAGAPEISEETTAAASAFADETGMMLAAEETDQGKTGWYHDREGQPVFWHVSEGGTWTRRE